MNKTHVRIDVNFSGQVQGVGFRYTAQRIALAFSVTGFVSNLSNGRVHLLAEGEKEEISAFVEAIRQSMDDYIDNAESRWSEATDEFISFEIRR